MLLKDTADICRFVNNINKNSNWDRLSVAVSDAEDLFIIPAIGKTFYDQLNSQYAANVFTGANALVLPILQKALANYTVYLDIQTRIGVVGDAGYVENTSEKTTQARQWVQNQALENTFYKADKFLNDALIYMEGAGSFSLWIASENYTVFKELFFSTATEFNRYEQISESRNTFLAMRPYMTFCENRYIEQAISPALFTNLKVKYKANTLTSGDKILLDYIRRTLAYFTIYESIPNLNVSMTGTGLRVITTNDALTQKLKADDKAITEKMKSAKAKAESSLTELVRYLEATATVSVFPEFYNMVQDEKQKIKRKPHDNSHKTSFMV